MGNFCQTIKVMCGYITCDVLFVDSKWQGTTHSTANTDLINGECTVCSRSVRYTVNTNLVGAVCVANTLNNVFLVHGTIFAYWKD